MQDTIRQALISVSDKTGLAGFARSLKRRGIALLSTGGTAKALSEAGLDVVEIGDYTGFPEMLDGRVKTLHPKVHGGILARRDCPEHMAALTAQRIPTIDLVIVNLYPFQATVARADASFEQAIENIDIGGPALLRAAAKNYEHVGVVVDPADYPALIVEIEDRGALSEATRFRLAQKAFSHTAAYDGAISNYLCAREERRVARFPTQFNFSASKVQDLRYGENPHQEAAFYRDLDPVPSGIASYRQLQGKELSFNNLADADAAWECVKSLRGDARGVACVIVKHANPCGVALAKTPLEAYEAALATDPTSAFGGIIAFNAPVDAPALEAVSSQFVEVVISPAYDDHALDAIGKKTNVRVLTVDLDLGNEGRRTVNEPLDFKRVGGGLLLQTADTRAVELADLKVVTRRAPAATELADLLFAFRVAKYVKSNAIVYCANGRTLGIGAGQMSRVDSTRIAAMKAKSAKLELAGSVVASDAFFPFRDGLDVVADHGAVAVIQPGGSMRDAEVIAAADERGMAMVFTGVRHFRH